MNTKPFVWNFRGRRSVRFQDRDYSLPGDYFVTICAQDRACLFGEVQDGVMQLNDVGRIIEQEWLKTAQMRPNISIGPWVIMPNHLHFIVTFRNCEEPRYMTVGAHCVRPDVNEPIVILEMELSSFGYIPNDQTDRQTERGAGSAERGARSAPLPKKPNSLANLVAGFKAKTTSEYRRYTGQTNTMLWQRNYWESCLNTERQYANAEEYVIENPRNWPRDILNNPSSIN